MVFPIFFYNENFTVLSETCIIFYYITKIKYNISKAFACFYIEALEYHNCSSCESGVDHDYNREHSACPVVGRARFTTILLQMTQRGSLDVYIRSLSLFLVAGT